MWCGQKATGTRVLLVGLAGLLAGMAGLVYGQSPAPPEKIPGLELLERQWIERRQPTGDRSFYEILANLESGKDEWVTEYYFDQLQSLLKSTFAKALTKQPLDEATLRGLLHPDYRGGSLVLRPRPALRRDGYVQVVQVEPVPGKPVKAEGFIADLRRALARYQQLETTEFKIFGISADANEPTLVHLRVRALLAGTTPSGQVLQQLGQWAMDWRRQPDQSWRLVGIQPEPGWQAESTRKAFTDISACALGRDPAYRQLLRGIDGWAVTIDTAYGIDIYGQNGLAVGDVDGDGLEDFYVCQPGGLPNRLFRNNGDGTFTDIAPPGRRGRTRPHRGGAAGGLRQ